MLAEELGSSSFRRTYGLKYAYLGGGMYRGISSPEMIIALGQAGGMGYYGTGGLEKEEFYPAILKICRYLSPDTSFGVNLVYQPRHSDREEDIIACLLENSVRFIEISGFPFPTMPIIMYRCRGLSSDINGKIISSNRILLKVSNFEQAECFLKPPAETILRKLVRNNLISQKQAELARLSPCVDDLCCESDGGGYTNKAVLRDIFPKLLMLKESAMDSLTQVNSMHVGASGGLGSPGSIAAAFSLGADFVLLGSVHQATLESGTSDLVKMKLSKARPCDTGFVPARLFDSSDSSIQVLTKDSAFQDRITHIKKNFDDLRSIAEIDSNIKRILEEEYFCATVDEIVCEINRYNSLNNTEQAVFANLTEKSKLESIYSWYMHKSASIAISGVRTQQENFQIHTSPAIGYFNDFVKGTPLENWDKRNIAKVMSALMQSTAIILSANFDNEFFNL